MLGEGRVKTCVYLTTSSLATVGGSGTPPPFLRLMPRPQKGTRGFHVGGSYTDLLTWLEWRVMVVVKTEDQACGGSLPFYPFVEGTFCVLDLAQGGEGRVTPWEVEEPLWLVGGADEMWGLGPQTLTKLHAATCLTLCFQMNRLIKVTAKKPCQWWYLEQSRVSVGG